MRIACAGRLAALVCLLAFAAGCRPISGLTSGLEDLSPLAPPNVARPDALKSAAWVRAVAAPGDAAAPFEWQNAELEAWATSEPHWNAIARESLEDEEPNTRANAAILLARVGDARAAAPAVDVVLGSTNLPLRRAAAEALAELSGESAAPAIERLLAAVGDPGNKATYVAELHADLIRAMARHGGPRAHEELLKGLSSEFAEVRLAAVQAWPQLARRESARPPLDERLLDLRSDPDAHVRAAVLGVVAAEHHPRAVEFARRALTDHELDGRLAAIAALGTVGNDEAAAELDKLLDNPAEIIRAAAVDALSSGARSNEVLSAADDTSWRVRRNVARGLASIDANQATVAARQLLNDPSGEVRVEVVKSLERWPLANAVPLLLATAGDTPYLPGKAAIEQLRHRWPAAAELSMDMPAERRHAIVAALSERCQGEFGAGVELASAETAASTATEHDVQVSDAEVEQVAARVKELWIAAAPRETRDQTVAALVAFGPKLAPAVEQLVFERQEPLPEAVFREILPAVADEFAALDDLLSSDLAARRRAADQLAALATQAPMSRLAGERLALVVEAEADPLVWRSVMRAIATATSDAGERLAYTAASHPSPEVRRLACEHLAKHADGRHAAMLETLLSDDNASVATAALAALAKQPELHDRRALEAILASGDKRQRVVAAQALARHKVGAGHDALERLARDADADTRRQAAVAMGELGDAAFTATLISLLDDRLEIRATAVASLEKCAAARPKDIKPTASLSEKAEAWRRWWRGGTSAVTQANATTSRASVAPPTPSRPDATR